MAKNNHHQKSAALLVLNYNSRGFLAGCLDSLLSQSYGYFEVIVIDNCSDDGSARFVREHYPQVRLIENSENVGVGKGFNDVIKSVAAEFDYIGLLNSDIRVPGDWLKELVRVLDGRPGVEVCASLVLDWKGEKVDTAGGTIINFLVGIFGGFLDGVAFEDIPARYQKEPFPVFFGVVTAMLVRASAFERFGLFDEDYFMYFEDIDFCWRVLLGGGKILCNPQAIVYHYGHGSGMSRKVSLKLLGRTETNLLATYYKNLSTGGFAFVIIPLLTFRSLASLLYLPVSLRIVVAKLGGIFNFLKNLILRCYRDSRGTTDSLRRCSDCEVLALNPGPLISFTPVFSVLYRWLMVIRKAYHDDATTDS